MRTYIPLLILSGLCLAVAPVLAQSNQFRGTRAHLGVGVGLFTYYGPVDLTEPEGGTNYIQKSDPAVVLLGSFPIVGDRFYFRGLVGFTNFDTKNEEALLADRTTRQHTAQNEFLVHELFFFEPEIVFTLMPGSRSRFLPYIYTGFGGLLADPFSDSDNNVNRPGTGIPGPERSVFALPVGIGVDFAFSELFSIFFDASYRFNFNYVARNEVQGVNPHNTSLLMGGIRMGLRNPFRREIVEHEPLPIPDPIEIPAYQPPPPAEAPPATRCVLVELNTVYFAYNSTELDAEARRLLDANVEALRVNPECCVEIVGYTDRDDGNTTYALRISRQRAEAVHDYYLRAGIDRERMRVRAEGVAVPPCDKEDEGPGCRRNRRVESIPLDCDRFLRQIER